MYAMHMSPALLDRRRASRTAAARDEEGGVEGRPARGQVGGSERRRGPRMGIRRGMASRGGCGWERKGEVSGEFFPTPRVTRAFVYNKDTLQQHSVKANVARKLAACTLVWTLLVCYLATFERRANTVLF